MGSEMSKKSNKNIKDLKNEHMFNYLASNKKIIKKEDLHAAWTQTVDSYLYLKLEEYLYSCPEGLTYSIYNQFERDITSSSYDEKAELILRLVNCSGEKNKTKIHQFVRSVILSVLQIEKRAKKNTFICWGPYNITNESCSRYSSYIVSHGGQDKSHFDSPEIRNMLCSFEPLMSVLFSVLFGSPLETSMFPKWLRLTGDFKKELRDISIIDHEDILFLNNQLPVDWQKEWRLLFSTRIHGESFARLSGQILNEGPTLIILRDSHGYVFGGFAPESWSHSPKFAGDSSCFLFTLKPEINLYPSSNFNQNYQYLNNGQQTLPNGLGMGGKFEYFGLWLDSEFGKGISNDSCTTFRSYKRLSHDKEFNCRDVEVWGVGDPPLSATERGERNVSVLDKNLEVKAILDIAGRKTYSDGLRDVPEDEE